VLFNVALASPASLNSCFAARRRILAVAVAGDLFVGGSYKLK
jgi:hypothetical protein